MLGLRRGAPAQHAESAERAAIPARGDADGPVPEPGPLQIEPGRADRFVDLDGLEDHVEAIGRRHADRLPRTGDALDARGLEVDVEQELRVAIACGDARAIEAGRARAEPL